ncbi:hypothetical protein QBC44DRAFT_304099 [Cladorrhinum sp. PSN332]|nr:hypothetical protein QBC44DRAFT_304099 [Cladorrhinum sp. PSN332]
MLLYYEFTSHGTGFERFMNSQNFGVRALFAALGFVLSLIWDDCFSDMVSKHPYNLLSRRSDNKGINASSHPLFTSPPPVTPFNALTPSSLTYHLTKTKSPIIPLPALTSLLAKLTPPLLANIPFSPWITWRTHQICAWSAMGILMLMLLVLLYVMIFVRDVYLPVHPGLGSGLAGGMYYLCDSGRVLSGLARGHWVCVHGNVKENEVQKERRENHQAAADVQPQVDPSEGQFCGFGRMVGSETGDVRIGIDLFGYGREQQLQSMETM